MAGSDKKIYKTDETDGKSVASVDCPYTISQLEFLTSGKIFLAGLGENGHPGSV